MLRFNLFCLTNNLTVLFKPGEGRLKQGVRSPCEDKRNLASDPAIYTD